MANVKISVLPVTSPTFTPALPPPPGLTSQPNTAPSLAMYSHITVGVCIPFITIAFFLRTYVRIFIKTQWGFEDVMTTVAWSGTIAYCAIMETTMRRGGGKHAWDITPQQFHSAAYVSHTLLRRATNECHILTLLPWFNVAAIFYGIMICITKLAVLMLYRRVFSPKRWDPFDLAIISLAFICIGFYVATTFVKIFECSPRAKIWDASIPGHCVNLSNVLKTSGSFNLITDTLILLLPIQRVSSLRMSKQKKILVIAVFTFGSCAPIFALIGFIVRLRNSANKDASWKQPEILLWGAAELSSGILCICSPELGPLIYRLSNHGRDRTPAVVEMDLASPSVIQAIPHEPRRGFGRAKKAIDSGIGFSGQREGLSGPKGTKKQRSWNGWLDSGLGTHDSGLNSRLNSIVERSRESI